MITEDSWTERYHSTANHNMTSAITPVDAAAAVTETPPSTTEAAATVAAADDSPPSAAAVESPVFVAPPRRSTRARKPSMEAVAAIQNSRLPTATNGKKVSNRHSYSMKANPANTSVNHTHNAVRSQVETKAFETCNSPSSQRVQTNDSPEILARPDYTTSDLDFHCFYPRYCSSYQKTAVSRGHLASFTASTNDATTHSGLRTFCCAHRST